MSRLAELDLPDRLAPMVPRWLTQVGFGLMCGGISFVGRMVIDLFAPGSVAFGLLFPTIALATLFARWQSGLVTAIVTVAYAWTFIYTVRGAPGITTLIVVCLCCAGLIAVAELFRVAAYRAAQERDREIAERDLFLAEFDHRVKNNFAVVASLLELQRRRAADDATKDALSAALARVESIARAHRHLYRGGASSGKVEMSDYIGDLCSALADSLFLHGTILLEYSSDTVEMPRDRAVSIGLVVNELVTNAVKHAFVGRDRGTIRVTFRDRGEHYVLSVVDDGSGIVERTETRTDGGGLGSRLIDAFARQAAGTITTDSDKTGTQVTLELTR